MTDLKTPSPLGLGCSRIGSFNNPQSLGESERVVRSALDLDVTLLDTSNIYGQGDSERVIGRAIKGRRDQAFVVTKTGRGFSTKMRLLQPLKPFLRPLLRAKGGAPSAVTARRGDALRYDWKPEAFAPSVDASLRRLDTDYIDGLLLHSPPAAVAGDPAVGAALAALRQAGKVRRYGVSCDDSATLDAALTMDGIGMIQLPWDVIAVTPDLAARTVDRGIVVLAREVIRLQPGLTPHQAVAASVAHPGVSCTLVGTTRIENLLSLVQMIDG